MDLLLVRWSECGTSGRAPPAQRACRARTCSRAPRPRCCADAPHGERAERVYVLKRGTASRLSQLATRGGEPLSPAEPATLRVATDHDKIMAALAASQSAEQVLTVVSEESARFTPVCLSAALHRLARLVGAAGGAVLAQDARWGVLSALAETHVVASRPRNLANSAWAFATLCVAPSPTWLARFKLAALKQLKRVPGFDAQQVSNSLWAFATMDCYPRDDELLAAFASAAAAHATAGRMLPQHVSNVLWSLAALRAKPSEEVLRALTDAALRVLPQMNSQNYANTLFALARLGYATPPSDKAGGGGGLLPALAAATLPRLSEFSASELSSSLWAWASLGCSPGRAWLRAHEAASSRQLHSASAQVLSTTLLAWSKLRHTPKSLPWYGTCLRARLREATPQTVANALGAFGALSVHARAGAATSARFTAALASGPAVEVVDALAAHAASRLGSFKPSELAQSLWGLATLSHDPGREWRLAFLEASDVVGLTSFAPTEMASSLWAFASLGVSPGEAWLERWEASASPRWHSFEMRHAVNVIWALTVLQSHHPGWLPAQRIAQAAWARLASAVDGAGGAEPASLLPNAGWCALYQAALLQCTESGDAAVDVQVAFPLSPACLAHAAAAWRHQAGDTKISGLQREVSHILFAGLGVPHTLEKLLEGQLASVDIAIEPPGGGVRVALEVDGPRHYLRSHARRARGATLLRNRLLVALGWRVVVLPYQDWPASGFDARVAYLRTLLSQEAACPWL